MSSRLLFHRHLQRGSGSLQPDQDRVQPDVAFTGAVFGLVQFFLTLGKFGVQAVQVGVHGGILSGRYFSFQRKS